jgi:tRNA(fMet)-specific endonuclease VapC
VRRSALPETVVVDTDVFSYIFRGDSRADFYRPHLAGCVLVLSFMTLAEIEAWAGERHWGRRTRERLEQTLAGYALQFPDRDHCRLWARVTTGARRLGRPIGVADAWIAATALLYNAPLATHNAGHFAGVPGLLLITEAGHRA